MSNIGNINGNQTNPSDTKNGFLLDSKENYIVRAYFGKFQPDMYFLLPKTSEGLEDCLNEFKEIDPEYNKVDYLTSGKVRFSIRGFFIDSDKKKFICNPIGPKLLTCIWSIYQQFGADTEGSTSIEYMVHKFSSSGNTKYTYVVSKIEE